MTTRRVGSSVLLASLLPLVLGGCLQNDQALPFDLDDDASAVASIGPEGGVVSLATGFSLRIPSGALTSTVQITVAPRITSPFSTAAGPVLVGTAFDISPAGLVLAQPARVEIHVGSGLLVSADLLRLGVALERGGIVTLLEGGGLDLTSGILSAPLSTLGSVAGVLSDDAIPLEPGLPPDLGGGTFGTAGSGSSSASVEATGLTYVGECSPTARRCFTSGLVSFWVSDALRTRLGDELAILAPELSGNLEFSDFDSSGQPTAAIGRLRIQGTLKARLGQSVSSYAIDEEFVTGSGGEPSSTGVTLSGNRLILATTTGETDRTLEYGIRTVGTGQMLTLELTEEIDLENDDGSHTTGTVTLHVRLRR